MELELERRDQANKTGVVGISETASAMISPMVDEDYWEYRVRVSDEQAVVGFPKYTTIGVGFAVEDGSWNTNLPYTLDAEYIANHIDVNRPKGLRRATVVEAIKLIQAAAHADRGTTPKEN